MVVPKDDVDPLQLRIGADLFDSIGHASNGFDRVGAGLLENVESDGEIAIQMAPSHERRFADLDRGEVGQRDAGNHDQPAHGADVAEAPVAAHVVPQLAAVDDSQIEIQVGRVDRLDQLLDLDVVRAHRFEIEIDA